MNHTAEKIKAAFIQFCRYQDKPRLPELWSLTFPVDFQAVSRMSNIHGWFAGFSAARHHGMWWSIDNLYGYDRVTLHATTGEKPIVDDLQQLIMWLGSLEIPPPDGKITQKNFSLLTRATEPYSY
jgi:hypothetical protein